MLFRNTVAALVLAVAQPGQSAPDGAAIVKQGNASGALACATCHGDNGVGQGAANFVRLAGLNEAYLAKQLRDFASGARANAVMKPIAGALTDKEKSAVARYFAALPPPAPAADVALDNARRTRGETLARRGDWSRDVPACFRCHGDNGRGVPPHFPAITGQPAVYVEAQMKAWRDGARRNDPVGLMAAVAQRLTDDDIKAVAAYLANYRADGAQDNRR